MDNPWRELSGNRGRYILWNDVACLEQHNASASASTRFMLDSIPEPFIGNPKTAKVVFLGKNPGHSADDAFHHQNDLDLRHAMFQNLKHELDEYSFYPLNPAFANTGVGMWWSVRTRDLQEAVDWDWKLLATRIMVIEWFPYHSKYFSVPKCKCPSQDYSFHLVKRAIDKGVLVAGMRARKLWKESDPRLDGMPFLKNPQCGHISRGNAGDGLFERILAASES